MVFKYYYVIFFLAESQICFSAEPQTSVLFTANDKIQTSDAPTYVAKESHVFLNCSISSASTTWKLFLTNETNGFINSTGSSVVMYHIYSATCGDSGKYTCGMSTGDDNLTKTESVIYLMVSGCPPRTQTQKAELHTNAIYILCFMADKGMFNFYHISVNGRIIDFYDAKYHANYVEVTPIHFKAYVSLTDVRPEDYRTYEVLVTDVMDSKRPPLMTYSFTVEGIGDKCPSDWCQAKEKKCIYVDGPSPSFSLARDRRQLFGGELVSDPTGNASLACIAEQMKRAKTSSMVAIDSNRQCGVLQLEPFSFGDKSSCRKFRDFYFGCQILYWSYQSLQSPLNVNFTEFKGKKQKFSPSFLFSVFIPGAVVTLALAIGPVILLKIMKEKQLFNSRLQTSTSGAEEGYAMLREPLNENVYDTLNDVTSADVNGFLKDHFDIPPHISTQDILPSHTTTMSLQREYITPKDGTVKDNSSELDDYVPSIESKADDITPVDIDHSEYITPLESYISASGEKYATEKAIFTLTPILPSNGVLVVDSEKNRSSTDKGSFCENNAIKSSNVNGELEAISSPSCSIIKEEELELSLEKCFNKEISLENVEQDCQTTKVKQVDDLSDATKVKQCRTLQPNTALAIESLEDVSVLIYTNTEITSSENLNVSSHTEMFKLKTKELIPSYLTETGVISNVGDGQQLSHCEFWGSSVLGTESQQRDTVTQMTRDFNVSQQMSSDRLSEAFLKLPNLVQETSGNESETAPENNFAISSEDETNVKQRLDSDSVVEERFQHSDPEYTLLNLKLEDDHLYWKINHERDGV